MRRSEVRHVATTRAFAQEYHNPVFAFPLSNTSQSLFSTLHCWSLKLTLITRRFRLYHLPSKSVIIQPPSSGTRLAFFAVQQKQRHRPPVHGTCRSAVPLHLIAFSPSTTPALSFIFTDFSLTFLAVVISYLASQAYCPEKLPWISPSFCP